MFNLTCVHFFRSVVREVDLSDFADLPDVDCPDTPTTYKVLKTGSSRGGQLLVSSSGYSYGIKRMNESPTKWQCIVRNQTNRCYATVIQKGDQFLKGVPHHTHPADVKMSMQKELFSKVSIM